MGLYFWNQANQPSFVTDFYWGYRLSCRIKTIGVSVIIGHFFRPDFRVGQEFFLVNRLSDFRVGAIFRVKQQRSAAEANSGVTDFRVELNSKGHRQIFDLFLRIRFLCR